MPTPRGGETYEVRTVLLRRRDIDISREAILQVCSPDSFPLSMNAAWETWLEWSREGPRAALGRVMDSSPGRPHAPETAFAVSEEGLVVGSIPSGCVDADICERAQEVIRSGVPDQLWYDSTADEFPAPAPPCGGRLSVVVGPVNGSLRAVLAPLLAAIREGHPVSLATILIGAENAAPRHVLISTTAETPPQVPRWIECVSWAETGSTRVVDLPGADPAHDLRVFVQSFHAPPRMLVFGADDFAAGATTGSGISSPTTWSPTTSARTPTSRISARLAGRSG